METCFFTFRCVFIKDRLKEKSDVSFMASPSGLKCYHPSLQLRPRIRNVGCRFLRSWHVDSMKKLPVSLQHNNSAGSFNPSS